jgi:hypothetical protein
MAVPEYGSVGMGLLGHTSDASMLAWGNKRS